MGRGRIFQKLAATLNSLRSVWPISIADPNYKKLKYYFNRVHFQLFNYVQQKENRSYNQLNLMRVNINSIFKFLNIFFVFFLKDVAVVRRISNLPLVCHSLMHVKQLIKCESFLHYKLYSQSQQRKKRSA